MTEGKNLFDRRIHMIQYNFNNSTNQYNYWKCSNKKCSARITTIKTTNAMVGENLPGHDHGNQRLKRSAAEAEKDVIKRMAVVPGTTAKRVLSEVSSNLQRSPNPGLVCSMRSAGAIKMALWREKNKVNPTPKLPKNFEDIIGCQLPEKFTQTNDSGEFLILQSWTDNFEQAGLLVFLSDLGANILKTHSLWLMDGTFRSIPAPFSQVGFHVKLS